MAVILESLVTILNILLGFIAGVSLCIFIVVVEIWIDSKHGLSNLKNATKKKFQTPSEILKPKTQKETDVNEIIKKNELKGKDTTISEIYED